MGNEPPNFAFEEPHNQMADDKKKREMDEQREPNEGIMEQNSLQSERRESLDLRDDSSLSRNAVAEQPDSEARDWESIGETTEAEGSTGIDLLGTNSSTKRKKKKCRRWKREELDFLGVSVYYLQTFFMQEVLNAGLDKNATINDMEDIDNPEKNDYGIIRRKGENFRCPIDGRNGAAYVHSKLDPDDKFAVGISIEGLEDFEDHHDLEMASSSETHDHRDLFDEDTAEPIDESYGSNAVENHGDAVYHVGLASIVLGYTWSNSIGQILDALEEHCRSNDLDSKSTYVWMRCLCINQHRVVERRRLNVIIQPEKFAKITNTRITKIGHFLGIMAPWQSPDLLKSAWPIYEMHMAAKAGCKVTFAIPSTERENFIHAIDNSSDIESQLKTLSDTLSNMCIQNTDSPDLYNILNSIEDGPGYECFNLTVKMMIFDWLIGLVLEVVNSRRQLVGEDSNSREMFAGFLVRVGFLFQNIGQSDLAIGLYREVLIIYENIYGRNHANVATTLNNIAFALRAQGKRDEALEIFREALVVCESVHGRKHTQTATTMNNIGVLLRARGKFDDALEILTESLEIKKSVKGQNHVDTARSLHNVATLMRILGQSDESLKLYKEALIVREMLLGTKHPSTVSTRNNIARLSPASE